MLALTLWQPWAWAILHLPAELAKPCENRDWMPPRALLGQRIALHGGKRWDPAARHAFAAVDVHAYLQLGDDMDTLSRRAGILGTVRLAGVVEERRDRLELVAGSWGETSPAACAPWFVGRYGWLLDQRQVLEVPIPCRGFQKLWTVPDEVAARLSA